jgi:putative transposase
MAKKLQKLSPIEQEILEKIQSGNGVQEAFAPLMKRVMEAALQGELEAHLEEEMQPKNYRNGKTSKTIKSSLGEFELDTPRDRSGSVAFKP